MTKHSAEHALLDLIEQIYDSFNDKNDFFGIFTDLCKKLFDTVDHSVSLKMSEHYGKNEGTCLGFKVIYQTVNNTLSISKIIKL